MYIQRIPNTKQPVRVVFYENGARAAVIVELDLDEYDQICENSEIPELLPQMSKTFKGVCEADGMRPSNFIEWSGNVMPDVFSYMQNRRTRDLVRSLVFQITTRRPPPRLFIA